MDLVSGCLSFTCGSFTLTMWYGLVRTRTRRVYDTVDIVYIIYKHTHLIIIEGSLKVKLPTIWTDGKAEVGRVREEKSRSGKRKNEKKEDAGARKGRKVAKHYVFPMIFGSGGSKSMLAEAAGAEPSGQMRDEKLHASCVLYMLTWNWKCVSRHNGVHFFDSWTSKSAPNMRFF